MIGVTVLDIISIIPDWQYVLVVDNEGYTIARYNGRDSIPETLNGNLVSELYGDDGWIIIRIDS